MSKHIKDGLCEKTVMSLEKGFSEKTQRCLKCEYYQECARRLVKRQSGPSMGGS